MKHARQNLSYQETTTPRSLYSLALCSAESSIDSVAYTVRDGWSRDFRWFLVVIARQNGYNRGN